MPSVKTPLLQACAKGHDMVSITGLNQPDNSLLHYEMK